MELKRAIKKIPSESNLKLLSSLIISLANKVDSTSEKCINPFTPNTAYAKGSYVTHDNYIYESKIACNDADWVESHWVRLSDTIEELSVNDVKNFLSLTQEQLDTLASIISTEVRLDKCFSSSDTYTRIQDALKEAKQYCITELAKKSTGSFKKANDTTEVTDGNYLYLILNPSTSKYDIYALVDSNVELLTSVDVNLDNYYTKTEVDNDFLKKTDATSTYATIATVDGKVDKTNIVDNLTSTDTDKPLSANQGKVLKDEVDLKANDDEVVKKTDIVTTIDKTSTNNQVPSAKAIYNKSKNKITDLPNGTDIIAYADSISNETVADTVRIMNAPNSPYKAVGIGSDFYYTIYNITDDGYKRIVAYDIRKNDMYMIMKHSGTWGKWRKVCTTSVKDVAKTNITFTDTTNYSPISQCFYRVKNGICYVFVYVKCINPTNSDSIVYSSLPLPLDGTYYTTIGGIGNTSFVNCIVNGATGNLAFRGGIVNNGCIGNFSYPVAES